MNIARDAAVLPSNRYERHTGCVRTETRVVRRKLTMLYVRFNTLLSTCHCPAYKESPSFDRQLSESVTRRTWFKAKGEQSREPDANSNSSSNYSKERSEKRFVTL